MVNLVHIVQSINLVLAILVDFGSLCLHSVLATFVSFGKYGLLVNLVHMIHLINMVLTILDNFTYDHWSVAVLTVTVHSSFVPTFHFFKNMLLSALDSIC